VFILLVPGLEEAKSPGGEGYAPPDSDLSSDAEYPENIASPSRINEGTSDQKSGINQSRL
jgi:hypothetical protein